jgi:hypothetical protein
MLTPDYLQGAPAELEELFLRLEEDIIADICRRIAKAGYLTDSAEHQVLRLRELGAGTEYIKQKISEYSELSDEAVDRLFFDAAQTSDEFYKKAYAQANVGYTPYEYNDFFQQAVTASVNQTKGELRNFTQSMGFSYRGSNGQVRFHDAAEAYRDCLDYAYMQVMTGAVDHNTAVRNATRRLTEGGLQFVDYASGVRCHADVAARRAVLTGLSQMTGKVSEHNAAELGTDIVEVDAHAGARPDHAQWQGKWYSLSGKSKKYPSLKAVTGYGTVTGLKGANCRHDFYPVIEGISEPSYTEEELKNIDPPPFEYNGKTYTYYEATQRQRAMERSMRKTKREILAADATDDKDRFTEKSVLLRRQKEEYGRFSKAAGLSLRNERAQVGGFGHSQASRAVWAAKGNQKPLENKISSNPKRTDTNAYAGLTSKTDSATIKSINSGSKLFTEENRIKMLQHERIISGNKYEKAIIYKPDGSIDFQKKGNSDSVSFSTKEIKSMDGKVLTHNHPNGTIPSPADINIMRRGKLAEIRACNSDGAYVIRRSGKWSSELTSLKKIDSAYNSCIDEILLKYQKIASENGENFFKYFDKAEKEGLQLFCDKYNLEFSWEDKNENKY